MGNNFALQANGCGGQLKRLQNVALLEGRHRFLYIFFKLSTHVSLQINLRQQISKVNIILNRMTCAFSAFK
jgi:hypothetical protein